jgi:hypothetical protein
LSTDVPADICHRKVPLAITTKNEHGTKTVNHSYILKERERIFDIDPTGPLKLNAGTSGFCELLAQLHGVTNHD